MNTDPEVQEQLDKMADYIEEHGWTQGATRLSTGEVCITGALHYADMLPNVAFDEVVAELHQRTGLQATEEEYIEVHKTKPASFDLSWKMIQFWNDYLGRTKDQVIRMLRGKDLAE